MIAVYKISFHEPWQGAFMTGTFNRWVTDEEDAVNAQIYYEIIYKKKYKDEYAKVELVSVS